MVVQHNMQAMNANRQLNITTGAQGKSTEKLSSGYKINRAADDAAGLSISEKMRRQIRGLDRASTNAQDGVSSIQTAEGALNEVHDMLQRMNELANQAANGTNSASDRQSIQDEISQLNTEIDRVAETTKFNETYLLKGDAGTKEITLKGHDAGIKGTLSDQGDTAKFEVKLESDSDISISSHNYHIYESGDEVDKLQKKVDDNDTVIINGTTYTKVSGSGSATAGLTAVQAASMAAKYEGSAAALKACTALKNASVAKLEGSVATKEGSITVKQACVKALKAKAASIQASVPQLEKKLACAQAKLDSSTSQASITQFSGSIAKLTACIGLKNASVGKMNASADKKNACVTTLKASATARKAKVASVQACADLLSEKAAKKQKEAESYGASEEGSAIFKADGKEYKTNEIKALIVDGAKVGFGKSQARTAVDPTNNQNNKTLAEVKTLIQDALTQANQIGADDETKVKVSEAMNQGESNYSYTITKGKVEVAKEKSFELHVGADADLTNKIAVNIETMNSKYLGVQDLNVVDDTGVAATYAIDAIEDALSKVSAQRSELGAVQNRLEHTITNLDNVVENTQSAESSIRDTDIADEMVRYSKNNILSQAGQSMLAQANQSTQGALSLLG